MGGVVAVEAGNAGEQILVALAGHQIAIVERGARIFGLELTSDGAREIAARARGTFEACREALVFRFRFFLDAVQQFL